MQDLTPGRRPRIAVVGSVNLDLVARCERLPRPGETITGASFARVPGGKGANQALAAARLGAEVTLVGAVGSDPFAEEALASLVAAGVELPVQVDADLTVVNRYELETLGRRDGLVALTLGAEGAVLLEDGEEVAKAAPPTVDAVDGTGAGDAFTACLVVSLVEGRRPEDALR